MSWNPLFLSVFFLTSSCVDVKRMAMRQANLDLFIHPVKKACTLAEVDREASLYKCNLCHRSFICPQGLGSHMTTAHREKDKAAGGIRAPKFGSAKPMAPEVAYYGMLRFHFTSTPVSCKQVRCRDTNAQERKMAQSNQISMK